MKGEAISLYPLYHLHPFHRHLDISWFIVVESSPLRIAGNRNKTFGTFGTLSLEFILSALALVAAVLL